MTVTVGPEGLLLDGESVPLWSGEVHYWRLDPADWPAVLDAVRDLGFGTVSSYIPWVAHETAPGECDFACGARDLPRFLALVAERGMRFIARPGPDCGAELETSGWPRRVLDDPRCQALRPDGRPYLLATSVHQAFMPSYASRQTLAEVADWYDAVCEVLAPQQWPAGPVVAVHVDNEMAFHFQPHAFALDHHPDAIAQFHEFLQERYDGIAGVNAAWGTAFEAWPEVTPPADGREQPEARRVDWVRFREHHVRRSLVTLGGMLRNRGIDRVPLVHNDYPRLATPLDQGALEGAGTIDLAAADVYATRQGGRFVRDVTRRLAGSSRLPHLAEMGVGWITLPWLLPMAPTPQDIEHCTWRALAGGARGANVFMLVDRDRWFGSPLSAQGKPREPLATFYRELSAVLAELEWPRLRRDVRLLLLDNRDEGRRTAARAVRGDLVPPFSQLLPIDRRLFDGTTLDDVRLSTWERDLQHALDDAGHEWDAATTDALPDLDRYEVVVVPSLGLLDPAAEEALAHCRASVLVGPEPLAGLAHASDAQAVLDALRPPAFCTDEDDLDLTRLTGGGREVLVAINAGDTALASHVRIGPARRLVGHWPPDASTCEVEDGEVTLSLAPWAAQVWEVHR